jgi:signal transduction histidine kinase
MSGTNENTSIIDGVENISFSVDAGIINRLGKELVGRAETAVSELVKNAYDADARLVTLNFIDSEVIGGKLEIQDDGNGMDKDQLIKGFMRLSSSDKFHNPVSPVYNRLRAGKKGIGRFATQRLGNKLTIITKTESADKAWKLEVDWTKYEIDLDLNKIFNPIKEVDATFVKGTLIIIEDLREAWQEAQIKKVFRYVSDLLQPDFLTDRSQELHVGSGINNSTFAVICYKTVSGIKSIIIDLDKMVFENALAVIEGYVENGKGLSEVVSGRFGIDDDIDIEGNFDLLDGIHFKVYYFIYSYEYYEGFIPKMEYNKISSYSNNGGIRMYRNGFRVLPYGEIGNDWLNIDKTSVKTESGAYVPFNNNNFFGFVEVLDPTGQDFEETSSREGLIENEAFEQLTDFVNKALLQSARRINSARAREKSERNSSVRQANEDRRDTRSTQEKLTDLLGENAAQNSIINEAIFKLEEAEMLRVLAAIGLNVAEFTHEIRQFIPSFNGSINFLLHQNLETEAKESLRNLKDNFNRFKTYTAYIDHTITQNVNRDKQVNNLPKIIEDFHRIIVKDLLSENIEFNVEYYDYDLYTHPMHPSEWTSILYNLYSNAKKAIKRAKPEVGKIQLICGKESKLYLEFMDNGDGIKREIEDRIFDAFFTTSTAVSFNAEKNELVTGTGLGLKIVRDILKGYNDEIFLTTPEPSYSTNFRIEVAPATANELDKYGN